MFGRSRVGLIALVVGALLFTAACSDDEPAAKPTPSATPPGPTLLTFAVYGPPPVITAYAKIAADFTAAHPGVVVNIKPYDTHSAARAALDAELGGKGAVPDAFLGSLTDMHQLMARKALARLDELLGERHVDFGDGFQRGALEAFSADNALQCMPVDISPLVVYYNTALVFPNTLTQPGEKPITAETGWKLDKFAEAARSVTGRGTRGVYVAPDLSQVAPFVWSGGGHVTDDLEAPSTLTLSSATSEAALTQLLEIVRDPQITFSAKQLARRSALDRFKAGKLGMILGYRELTPQLRAQQGLSFDVMPLPRIGAKATSGDSKGLCLSAASKHPEETADFLAYAVSTDAMTLLAETGYVVPTNLDVANSDAFLQSTQSPASAKIFTSGVRNIFKFPSVETWPSVATKTASLLQGLFYDPVIDPLDQRLKAIDATSVPLFTPLPSPSPSPSSGSSSSPGAKPSTPTESPAPR